MTMKNIQGWLPKDTRLTSFYEGMNSFLESHLIDHTDVDNFESNAKIVADPLLGYIHLNPWEVSIIDTKLYQRLRNITQLGLAYLVFPSLGYSRFEHSLGVLGHLNLVLNRLIENNSKISSKDQTYSIVKRYETTIRLAAIFHDIGHCLFSHVSERIISKLKGGENYPSASTIQQIFTNHFEKEKPIPFAEIFAVTIIGSELMQKFITKLDFIKAKQVESTLELAARFMLGLPDKKEADSIFISQLLSSGLDVDKIDYMAREAHYSGIKLEIDIDRILSKLQVFPLKISELPKNLNFCKQIYNPESNFMVLGFEKGGQFAFEEFCIARLALHVKIYLHQKVRAAEAQLTKYLSLISQNTFLEEAHRWLSLPETLLLHEGYILNTIATGDLDLFDQSRGNYPNVNFINIADRKLFHRAFGFGHTNSLSESVISNDIDSQVVNEPEMIKIFSELDNQATIYEIFQEYLNICGVLEETPNEELKELIILDIPRYLNIQQGHDSLYFQRPSLMPIRWTIPIDKIIIYYQHNRALAYLFSPPFHAHILLLASEIIIYKKTKKVFNLEGVVSKQVLLKATSIKDGLNAKNYYSDYPQLKIISDYLKTAEASELIAEICKNLSQFKSFRNDNINFNRVLTFINQFPVDLQKAALKFIGYLRIYDEHFLKNHILHTLESIDHDHKVIGFSPLGGIVDSANRLMYELREVTERKNIKYSILDDDLVSQSDILLLFDDNINSGLQLINIFAQWLDQLDKLPKEYLLNENHVDLLKNEENKQKFKKMQKYIVFSVGTDGVDIKVKDELKKFIDMNPETIHIFINEIFESSEKIFSGGNSEFQHEKRNELKKFIEEVATDLLRNEGKSDAQIATRTLGYANAEAMVLFPYNVPTMTITALWCSGIYNGSKWIPLAERRRREKDGVLVGEDM